MRSSHHRSFPIDKNISRSSQLHVFFTITLTLLSPPSRYRTLSLSTTRTFHPLPPFPRFQVPPLLYLLPDVYLRTVYVYIRVCMCVCVYIYKYIYTCADIYGPRARNARVTLTGRATWMGRGIGYRGNLPIPPRQRAPITKRILRARGDRTVPGRVRTNTERGERESEQGRGEVGGSRLSELPRRGRPRPLFIPPVLAIAARR